MINNFVDLKKITILIGPNGSGKTTFIKEIKSNSLKSKNIFDFANESLEPLYKGSTSVLEQKIKKWEKNIKNNSNFNEISNAAFVELRQNLQTKNNKIDLSGYKEEFDHKKILSKSNINLSANLKTEINKDFFLLKTIFHFNGHEFEYGKAPSGVKKMLLVYFKVIEKIKENSKQNKDLVIIEELENYLHPNWIKITVDILETLFQISGDEVKFIITTHNPEVIKYLRNYLEYFATPIEYGKAISYIDLNAAHQKYEEINANLDEHKKTDLDLFKTKVKVRLNLELARFLFCSEEKVLLCEGPTDQIVFQTLLVNGVVVPTFGYYSFGLYLGIYHGLYNLDANKKTSNLIGIVVDMDGKFDKKSSEQKKMKKKLIELLGEANVFSFAKNLEKDLFNKEVSQREGQEKWQLLEVYNKECNEYLKNTNPEEKKAAIKNFFEKKGNTEEVEKFFQFIDRFDS